MTAVEGLRRFPTPTQLAWVERTIGPGARVTGGRRMLGGITSSVHRLSVRLPTGVPTQVVLKRFCDPRWGDAQAIVLNEAAAIAAVEATAVPAPRILGVSPDCTETDGAPSLLMTRAAGRVWLTPHDLDAWIRQLAILLPTLHAGSADVWTHQRRDPDALTVPASALRPEIWTAARNLVATESPQNERALAHGDYQHFNVLWSRGLLSALVVDWATAGDLNRNEGLPGVAVGEQLMDVPPWFDPSAGRGFIRAPEVLGDLWGEEHGEVQPTVADVEVGRRDARRAPVDVRGMTGRVEELLATALGRV